MARRILDPRQIQDAKNGNHQAQYWVGHDYILFGKNKKDCERGYSFLNSACTSSNQEVLMLTGGFFQDKISTTVFFEKANSVFEKAASLGSSEAVLRLGENLFCGLGVKRDLRKSFKLFEKAAGLGNKLACDYLRAFPNHPRPDFNDSKPDFFLEMAEAGDIDSIVDIGKYLYKKKLFRLAYYCFLSISERTNPESWYYLGRFFYWGRWVPENKLKAFNWFSRAANEGHAKAQYYVGESYLQGDGISQNSLEAKRWFEESTKGGNSKGANALGKMFYFGQEIPQDYHESYKWFLQSAEQGNPEAQYFLGELLFQGLGISQDFKEARKWFIKTAGYDKKAALRLGELFLGGLGGGPGLRKAEHFLKFGMTESPREANLGLSLINLSRLQKKFHKTNKEDEVPKSLIQRSLHEIAAVLFHVFLYNDYQPIAFPFSKAFSKTAIALREDLSGPEREYSQQKFTLRYYLHVEQSVSAISLLINVLGEKFDEIGKGNSAIFFETQMGDDPISWLVLGKINEKGLLGTTPDLEKANGFYTKILCTLEERISVSIEDQLLPESTRPKFGPLLKELYDEAQRQVISYKPISDEKIKLEERNKVFSHQAHNIKNIIRLIFTPLENISERNPSPQIDQAIKGAKIIEAMANSISLSFKGSKEDFYFDAEILDSSAISLWEIFIIAVRTSVENLIFNSAFYQDFSEAFFPSSKARIEAGEGFKKLSLLPEPEFSEELVTFVNKVFVHFIIDIEDFKILRLGRTKGSQMKLMALLNELVFNALKYSSFVEPQRRFVKIQFWRESNRAIFNIENSFAHTETKTTGTGNLIIENLVNLMEGKINKTVVENEKYCLKIAFPNFWREKKNE